MFWTLFGFVNIRVSSEHRWRQSGLGQSVTFRSRNALAAGTEQGSENSLPQTLTNWLRRQIDVYRE